MELQLVWRRELSEPERVFRGKIISFSSYTLVRIPSGSYTFGSYTFGSYTFRGYTFHELPVAVDHLSGLRPVRDTQYAALEGQAPHCLNSLEGQV